MDAVRFKEVYIATFLATRVALQYDEFCFRGEAHKLGRHQPVEDAKQLADDAWDEIIEKNLGGN